MVIRLILPVPGKSKSLFNGKIVEETFLPLGIIEWLLDYQGYEAFCVNYAKPVYEMLHSVFSKYRLIHDCRRPKSRRTPQDS